MSAEPCDCDSCTWRARFEAWLEQFPTIGSR